MNLLYRRMPEPSERVEIYLKYEGADVDDGSMSIEDIVPVLQGFSSAYGKLALIDDPNSTHRIRIVGVRRGSADIVLEVWKFLGDNAPAIASLGVLGGGAYWITKKIVDVIKIKKHVKKRPFKEKVSSDNNVVITNIENVNIEVPLAIYELFKSGYIDKDISKITQPLEKDRIDAAELSMHSPDGTILQERITVEERPYFDIEETTTTTTQQTWLTAKLNALTKSTNSGFLYLNDGSRVFYRYTGDNPTKLYTLFSYQGVLRINCIANMDENLKVLSLEIQDLEKTQNDLFSHGINER